MTVTSPGYPPILNRPVRGPGTIASYVIAPDLRVAIMSASETPMRKMRRAKRKRIIASLL